jgi:hypothetical protein
MRPKEYGHKQRSGYRWGRVAFVLVRRLTRRAQRGRPFEDQDDKSAMRLTASAVFVDVFILREIDGLEKSLAQIRERSRGSGFQTAPGLLR